MKFGTLDYSQSELVATITIERPDAMNALNVQLINDFHHLLDHLEKASDIRVVILTGSGEKAFVAGADIKEIDQLTARQAFEFAQNGQSLFSRIEAMPEPVIAAVNGFALGGGLELALSCDFILASEKAKFGLPECTLGIIPGFGGTVRLPRRVGQGMAREMALSGNFYSSTEALQMGLANHVYPQAELMTEVRKLALTMASRAPIALSKIKKSMLEGYDLGLPGALEFEAKLFSSSSIALSPT